MDDQRLTACLLLLEGYPRSAVKALGDPQRMHAHDQVPWINTGVSKQRSSISQLLRALARIQERADPMMILHPLQRDLVTNLASGALIVHAHAASLPIPAAALDAAHDALDTTSPASPPAALLLLARMHWLTGALESARALLQAPADAGDPTARTLLAWVAVTHARQHRTTTVLLGFDDVDDDKSEARVLCDQALATRPNDPCLLVAAALAHACCGQHDTAMAHATQVLQLKPGWLPAAMAASNAALARGDWEAAAALAVGHASLQPIIGTRG